MQHHTVYLELQKSYDYKGMKIIVTSAITRSPVGHHNTYRYNHSSHPNFSPTVTILPRHQLDMYLCPPLRLIGLDIKAPPAGYR